MGTTFKVGCSEEVMKKEAVNISTSYSNIETNNSLYLDDLSQLVWSWKGDLGKVFANFAVVATDHMNEMKKITKTLRDEQKRFYDDSVQHNSNVEQAALGENK